MSRKCARCTNLLDDDWGYSLCPQCKEKKNLYCKMKYKEMREKGICYVCHKEPASEGYTTCEKCRDKLHKKKKEEYWFYIDHKICPQCKKENLYINERKCWKCLEYERRWREKNKPDKSERQKIQYHDRRERGLCVKCMTPTTQVYCEKCKGQKNAEYRKRTALRRASNGTIHRSERVSYGLCYTCGNPLDVDGKRMCSKCMSSNYIAQGKMERKANSNWQKDNEIAFIKSRMKRKRDA